MNFDPDRVKTIFKWAFVLVAVGFVIQILVGFIIGLGATLTGIYTRSSFNTSAENSLVFISSVVSMLVVLPFAYYFSYKAASSYLKNNKGKSRKSSGVAIAIGVVFFAGALAGIINYLLGNGLNFALGLIPLLLGYLAGKKAENLYKVR